MMVVAWKSLWTDSLCTAQLAGRMGSFWWQPDAGKERTYPELVKPGHKAKLVVFAGEVAGRLSEETLRSSDTWRKLGPERNPSSSGRGRNREGSLTCSRRGCCSFTVRQLEQTPCCESYDQSLFWSLPGFMTRTCGEDCAQSLKFPPLRVEGMPET